MLDIAAQLYNDWQIEYISLEKRHLGLSPNKINYKK